jgi:hypothetical protein
MSAILPVISMSEFTRKPNEVLENNDLFTVLISHNEDKAVILKPEIFAKIKDSELWRGICEEWWELHDKETLDVVKKGKQMAKEGSYKNAVIFK